MMKTVATAAFTASALFAATPASAGRVVIDGGSEAMVSGYCSPAALGTADCDPKALGFSITLGGQTFDSFVIHSNGIVSLGSAIDYADRSAAIAGYQPPVFSALYDNRVRSNMNPSDPGYGRDDGALVADATVTTDRVVMRWYPCTTRLFCGAKSLDASMYDGSGLTRAQIEQRQQAEWSIITLDKLADGGFSVTYSYSPRYDYSGSRDLTPSTAPIQYGFDVPGATLDQTGAAVTRTFTFDARGALVTGALVPEPASWAMMIAGFGLLGGALRRGRRVVAA